jgi:nicotinate-nucleotide adenylyltransferase
MNGSGEMNIGVMGGTFDPIHNGHLAIAQETRTGLKLSVVIFVPAGQPWMKSERPITPARHRFEMVRLAIALYPYFRLSRVEVDRAGPTYTIDTITQLRAELAAVDELYFILGWDSLAQLPQWRDVPRLIRLCRLVAIPRPGYSLPDLKSLESKIPGLSQRLVLLDKPVIDISATDIRNRVAQGLPIDHVVPKPVAAYIKRHKLYLNEGS